MGGFENAAGLTGGGIQATGNYPGKARTADELRADYEVAFSLIPGSHRANLHAIYAETGGTKVERDSLGPEHFAGWIALGKEARHRRWTSTRRISATPWRNRDSPFPPATRRCGTSG